jgi:hypothetical protein
MIQDKIQTKRCQTPAEFLSTYLKKCFERSSSFYKVSLSLSLSHTHTHTQCIHAREKYRIEVTICCNGAMNSTSCIFEHRTLWQVRCTRCQREAYKLILILWSTLKYVNCSWVNDIRTARSKALVPWLLQYSNIGMNTCKNITRRIYNCEHNIHFRPQNLFKDIDWSIDL